MNFRAADRLHKDLMKRHEAGEVIGEEFDARRKELMVWDDQGRWWAKGRDYGEWNRHDGRGLLIDHPLGYRRETPPEPPGEGPARPWPGANGSGRGVLGRALGVVLYIVAAIISFSVVSAACQALL